MELIRKNIHMSRQKARVIWQMTLDEDCVIPDHLPDMQQLILEKGVVEPGECKTEKDRVKLQGTLFFSLLYGCIGELEQPFCAQGRIPFDAQIHMEGVREGETVQISWILEDLHVSMVHSRKCSIKALITFTLSAEELVDEEMAVGVPQRNDIEMRMCPVSVAALEVRKHDTCRVKDEVILPMNQPNIQKILWQEMVLGGLDIRLGEGQIQLKGELQVFVLYQGEEEPAKTWWLTTSIPFTSRMECPGCQEQMIPYMEVRLFRGDVEVKPDYDGEMRMLNVDAVMEVGLKVYTEEHVHMLCDLYSTSRELKFETRKARCERLLTSNASRCRAMDRLRIAQKEEPLLQICNTSGEVKIDNITVTEQGLQIEGVVLIQVLYITADDKRPFRCLKGTLPFEHVLEAPGISKESIYDVNASLEQLHGAMVSSDEVEVKASVLLNGLVLEPVELLHMEQVWEEPLDLEKMKKMPGMAIYVVQPEDTLWEIAKTWHTTMEQIRSLNDLGQQEVKPGQRLLLLKQVAGF